MAVKKTSSERLHAALLHGLSLSTSDFASSAAPLHALVATVLSVEAGHVLRGKSSENGSSSRSQSEPISTQLRLVSLAVFHKLSGLQNGNPITLTSLHDFIIAYTADGTPASPQEARLARRIVDSLFRKKPSLVRALENQLLPAWIEMMTDDASARHDSWMQEAQVVTNSLYAMSKISNVRDMLQASPASVDFWSAFQTFYDIVIPKLLSGSIPADTQSISQISNIKEYTAFRKNLVDFFASYFPALSAETLTECIENEASNPDLPSTLTDLPLTSLVNMTLLQDAEYYHNVSRRVGLRKPAIGKISKEERTYIQNTLDFSRTIPKESISDGLAAMSKGKGKAVVNGEDGAPSASHQIAAMTSEVLSILPDASVEDIRRLLTSSALEQVAQEQKVERVVGMLLEGDLPAEEAMMEEAQYDDHDSPGQESTEGPKQSAFASVRRNVFSDRLETSRLHRGKQDFKNDTFLPDELRASILAAAERQAQESDEEDEEDADEAFAEVDEAGEALATVKVKDDVSEESGLDDDDENKASGPSRAGTPSIAGPSAASALGATGVPKELEKLYIAIYTKDPTVFTREAKKSPARADLKKKIAALKLPQSISDEQIEGWARMLERNPKKDKILERFNDKLFSGNQKGLDVNAAPADQKSKVDNGQQGSINGRGGHGERGRGRGRGRARQSDQRRRGHDRKMQKAGL